MFPSITMFSHNVQSQCSVTMFPSMARTELGTHITNVAVMADFMTGFQPPRNLYTQSAYRVWGIIPFAPGDFWLSNLLDLVYPGYVDASYYHDERGFSTPTPYTDTGQYISKPHHNGCYFQGCFSDRLLVVAADVLLSDCASDLLARYPIILLATPIISAKAEVTAKLEA